MMKDNESQVISDAVEKSCESPYKFREGFDAPEVSRTFAADKSEKPARVPSQANNLVKLYITDVKKHFLLSAEEEKVLAKKVQQGDLAAKRKMIESNLRLVVRIARKYQHHALDLLDLIAEGNLGLIRAIEKFNPDLNFRLSTYATLWVRQNIERALMNCSRTIRFPVHILKRLNNYYKVFRSLEGELGRVPTLQELMKATGLSLEKIEKIKQQNEQVKNINLIDDEFESKERQQVGQKNFSNPQILLQKEELRIRLEGEICRLPARHQEVLSRRFGLLGYQAETLEQVGSAIGLTRERVRQLQLEALKLLHQRFSCEKIRFEDLVLLEAEEL